MPDVEAIMDVIRRTDALRSGTVGEHCSCCLFWKEGWCTSHGSNVRKASWDMICNSYREDEEKYLKLTIKS